MAHAGGVIEHDPLRHTAQPLAQRQARALRPASTAPDRRSNTGNQARNDARCTTPRNSTSTSPKSACAPPGCHTRSMNAPSRPPRTHASCATARVTVDRETSAPCSSLNRSPDPGRGMPPPVRAILREPLLDHGQIRVDHRRARLSHRRHGRQILLREAIYAPSGSLTCPRDRRDGFPFRRKRRIDCTCIILSGPFWREIQAIQLRPFRVGML